MQFGGKATKCTVTVITYQVIQQVNNSLTISEMLRVPDVKLGKSQMICGESMAFLETPRDKIKIL